tara:strand:- start:2234 stop:3418 length:1185 start_codon:yes stop_codon:yes gene_type:complete
MDKNPNINLICPAPWDHHCINTNGRNRLCCNAVTSESKFLDGFKDYWIGDELTTVRNEMIAGKKPAACVSCWKKESIGVKSLRQQFIDNYKTRNEWDTFCKEIYSIKTYPIELDLKLGNYCNLSCRMCSSFSSSTYANEFKKIYNDTGIDYGINSYEKDFVQSKWYNDPVFVNTIKEIIDNGLRQLKFTGGEPLMVPAVKTLLTYCIDQNKSKDIDLVLITNGTLLTTEWIETLNQFKHVSFILSIDGVEDTFEYIRHPAKWSQMNDVFKLINDTNFYKSIAFTLQVYNLLDIENIINTARLHNFNIDLIALDNPAYLDVKFVPSQLQQDAISLLNNICPANHNEKSFISSCLNKLYTCNNDAAMQQQFVFMSRLKDKYKNQKIEQQQVWKYYE